MNWYGKDIIENAAASVVLEHNVGFSETNNISIKGFLGPSVSRKYLDKCRVKEEKNNNPDKPKID